MTCRGVCHHSSAYVLGELDRGMEKEIEDHLQRCPACRRADLVTRSEVARVADSLKTDLLAPAGMMDRVQSRLAAVPKGRRPYSLRIAAVATMVAGLAFAAALSLRQPPALPALASVASLASMDFATPAGHCKAHQLPPDLRAVNGHFVGPTLVTLGDSRFDAYQFQVAGEAIIAVEAPVARVSVRGMSGMCGRKDQYYMYSNSTRSVLAWAQRGMIHALVGPRGEDRLLDIARKAKW